MYCDNYIKLKIDKLGRRSFGPTSFVSSLDITQLNPMNNMRILGLCVLLTDYKYVWQS